MTATRIRLLSTINWLLSKQESESDFYGGPSFLGYQVLYIYHSVKAAAVNNESTNHQFEFLTE
jgi:hypothetical protein